jgi:hypothetical protein
VLLPVVLGVVLASALQRAQLRLPQPLLLLQQLLTHPAEQRMQPRDPGAAPVLHKPCASMPAVCCAAGSAAVPASLLVILLNAAAAVLVHQQAANASWCCPV